MWPHLGGPRLSGEKTKHKYLILKKKKAAQDPANQGRGQEDSSSGVSEVSSRAGSQETNRVWSSHRCPGQGSQSFGGGSWHSAGQESEKTLCRLCVASHIIGMTLLGKLRVLGAVTAGALVMETKGFSLWLD